MCVIPSSHQFPQSLPCAASVSTLCDLCVLCCVLDELCTTYICAERYTGCVLHFMLTCAWCLLALFALCFVCCNDDQCSVAYCELFALCDVCGARHGWPTICNLQLRFRFRWETFAIQNRRSVRREIKTFLVCQNFSPEYEKSLLSDKFKCSCKTNTRIMFQKKDETSQVCKKLLLFF